MNDINQKLTSSYAQQVATLFSLMGQVVWMIQHLEDALSHSIAIKDPYSKALELGNRILEENRRLPLGRAVELADNEKIYQKDFQEKLKAFVNERNWLIHRCMRESVDEVGLIIDQERLFKRIQSIGATALLLKETIEIDMLEFVSAKGRPDIRRTVEQAYSEWQRSYINLMGGSASIKNN